MSALQRKLLEAGTSANPGAVQIASAADRSMASPSNAEVTDNPVVDSA
ncbi:hypothetical protein KOXY103107_13805 [Komagataeibacter xylinus]